MYELELSYGSGSWTLYKFWQKWDTIMPIADLERIVGYDALAYGVLVDIGSNLRRRIRSENVPEDDGYIAYIFGRNVENSLIRYTSCCLREQVAHLGAIYQFFDRFKDDIRLTFRRTFDNISPSICAPTLSHLTIKPQFSCTNCGRDKYYDELTFIDPNQCTCNECEELGTRCDICGNIYFHTYCPNCFVSTPCYICGEINAGGLNKRKGEYGVCDKHKHLEPVPEKSYYWKPTMWKYRHMGKN